MSDYDKLVPGSVFVWGGDHDQPYLVLSREGDEFVIWWDPRDIEDYDPEDPVLDRHPWHPQVPPAPATWGVRASVQIVPMRGPHLARWVQWLKEHEDV